MANVLSTLFGDIANAIREKTGDTATIAPANFPTEIGKIETGGGSGGEMGATWKRYHGWYTPSSTSKVVLEHNIGVVPDIFVITTGGASENYVLTTATVFSSAMNEHIEGDKKGMFGILMGTNVALYDCKHGMETTNEEAEKWGPPRNATATTITIGGGTILNDCVGNLQGGIQYMWFAICGIFGDLPPEE